MINTFEMLGRALGLGKSEVKWELKLQMFIREMYV